METLAWVLVVWLVGLGTYKTCDYIHDFLDPHIMGSLVPSLITVIIVGGGWLIIGNYGVSESQKTVAALMDCIHDDSWEVLDNCRRDYPYEAD